MKNNLINYQQELTRKLLATDGDDRPDKSPCNYFGLRFQGKNFLIEKQIIDEVILVEDFMALNMIDRFFPCLAGTIQHRNNLWAVFFPVAMESSEYRLSDSQIVLVKDNLLSFGIIADDVYLVSADEEQGHEILTLEALKIKFFPNNI